ncbi:hypothetical protein GWO43_30625 [candidate division KSB1 bacterium]|nr:hypothetical protein [candidate division KSB1 bacterium]NIS28265.1 hypothetical protein [candidate division KSB1 bacterium]NIT75137.1 hypothetical protein [candidate division KSB1 bacterium]NIU28944.1 hypothetical protein [candidate division KSB1 bacterium]NIV97002.1 hypothetical protein [candidate division KSB1 bacterium]
MGHATKKLTPEDLKLTYEDYLLLPDDGKRYEIIEGDVLRSPLLQGLEIPLNEVFREIDDHFKY